MAASRNRFPSNGDQWRQRRATFPNWKITRKPRAPSPATGADRFDRFRVLLPERYCSASRIQLSSRVTQTTLSRLAFHAALCHTCNCPIFQPPPSDHLLPPLISHSKEKSTNFCVFRQRVSLNAFRSTWIVYAMIFPLRLTRKFLATYLELVQLPR